MEQSTAGTSTTGASSSEIGLLYKAVRLKNIICLFHGGTLSANSLDLLHAVNRDQNPIFYLAVSNSLI